MTHIDGRRVAAGLGLALVLGATVAAPASAKQDPGPRPTVTLPYSQDVYENHYGTQVAPPVPPAQPRIQLRRIDDNAVEYVQLGGGVLAGIALAGAGMAMASRRSHAHPAHPA
jgi:hypothetical protein